MDANSATYPSTTLFAALKACGISNREAASVLLDHNARPGGRPVAELLGSKSRLSRRVVHAAPGEAPAESFADQAVSVPALADRMAARRAVDRRHGNVQKAASELVADEIARAHGEMALALETHGSNAGAYRETVELIAQLNPPLPRDKLVLHLTALVAAGLAADGRESFAKAASLAIGGLGLSIHTAAASDQNPLLSAPAASPSDASFALAPMHGTRIDRGQIHPVGPSGLAIGRLPGPADDASAFVTDAAADVSRRHARLWVEDGRLFIADLGSTNGTHVVSWGSHRITVVAAPARDREHGLGPADASPVELHYGDILCLGSTSRYIVLPAPED